MHNFAAKNISTVNTLQYYIFSMFTPSDFCLPGIPVHTQCVTVYVYYLPMHGAAGGCLGDCV